MEKLPLGPQGRYSLVYRSFPLTAKNPRIERAVIVIHGAGRNANDYFSSVVAGALIAGALENTIVISPRLASNKGSGCADTLDAGEISWICGGADDWRRGGSADGISGVYTYTLVDELVKKLARRNVFPNMRKIVVTGHSAGGQFTHRYAAATRVENDLGVTVSYVVANPSSYLYLDPERLAPGASCTPKGSCDGEFKDFAEKQSCAAYNRWHYGMEERSGYAAPIPDEELKRQLTARNVVYLLGDQDTLPLYGFDSSCSAMAQGPSRLARGLAYWNYIRSKYQAKHQLVVVSACGHNGRCIYTADSALPVIFPK